MPKGSNQKVKLYYLAKIMIEKTDDEHSLTLPEISRYLDDYGITADRKCLYNDLATLEVLEAQLDHYPDLENDVAALADFTKRQKMLDYAGRIVLDEHDVPIFNFGKHKGRSVRAVLEQEPSYYTWMQNGDFTQDTKNVLTKIYLEGKNTK